MSGKLTMTKSQEKAFKELCDFISDILDTEKGKLIVAKTADRLKLGIKDLCSIATEQNVREMLVIHMATLPIFESLFGDRTRGNVMHLILNKAVQEISDMILEGKK
jgi:predicted helicase